MATVAETSAGGVVVDQSGLRLRVVLIGKRDRANRLVWSLPKGHVEEGESLAEAAVREVAEETGLTSEVIAELGTVDYWFVAPGKRIHKTVHHFVLTPLLGELSAADVEIEDVAWFGYDQALKQLEYADERRLLKTLPMLLGISQRGDPPEALHADSL